MITTRKDAKDAFIEESKHGVSNFLVAGVISNCFKSVFRSCEFFFLLSFKIRSVIIIFRMKKKLRKEIFRKFLKYYHQYRMLFFAGLP